MQTTVCPGCGAPLQFLSHASVIAVCGYCKTTALKELNAVKNLGKMANVLEDYSVLQLGTTGVWQGEHFTIIGRIQLRYSAGLWNEWYILFDSGKTGWLGDSSGLYTLTFEYPATGDFPAWNTLVPAHTELIDKQEYMVAEVRIADCIGGQGELPFKVGAGWQARVADFRYKNTFLTLDYSDCQEQHQNNQQHLLPKVFSGEAVTPETLKCQHLRHEEDIHLSAGHYKGKVDQLACTACGNTLRYVPGATTHLICSSCSTELQLTGSTTEVLATHERLEKRQTTLKLGAQATISGMHYELIGLMQRQDAEQTGWTEYLLYSSRAGFLWITETQEGWSRANVSATWPEWKPGNKTALWNSRVFQLKWEYQATVTWVAGAFNWQVKHGDQTQIHEFENGKDMLVAECSEQELTWSLSTSIPLDQMRAWFGNHLTANATNNDDHQSIASISKKFVWGLLIFNSIPLLFDFSDTWLYVLFGVAAIYIPTYWLKFLPEKDSL
ncbi:MAG: DUF4178 domain-containing protein [Pseudomonadota bacterium]